MVLQLTKSQQQHTDFTPRITVIGVGGGGTNAVDNMIALNLQGVDFVVANTDAQQLMNSRSDRRIQLGPHLTQGLGAGAKPEIGHAAAEEAEGEIARVLDGAHMVFITAGMGGGTGTGAAPVIARMARERGILTVGVVTKPFTFEGSRRARAADQGISELQQYVDTLIVIPNQNLFRISNERTGWKEAFKMADHVLYMGVRGVTDLMVAPGLVNLDFADIRTVMAEMGKAMMGTGEAEGEDRAIRAAEAAISNPLLEDTNMAGARGLLINITGGDDMTLFEVDQAANRIRAEVADDANIIFGSAIDEALAGRVRVSVVATGIDSPAQPHSAMAPPLAAGVPGGLAAAGAAAARPRLVAVAGAPMMLDPGVAELAQAAGAETVTGGPPVEIGAVASAPAEPPTSLHPAYAPPPSAPAANRPIARSSQLFADPPAEDVGLTAQAQQVRAAVDRNAALRGVASPLAAAPAFAPTYATAPAARVEAPGPMAAGPMATQSTASPSRPSLFRTVTGALRRAAPVSQAAPASEPPRVEPAAGRGEFARVEPVRQEQPSPRAQAPDEMGLDIPAFLRRQDVTRH